jgi:hypothetical protein
MTADSRPENGVQPRESAAIDAITAAIIARHISRIPRVFK